MTDYNLIKYWTITVAEFSSVAKMDILTKDEKIAAFIQIGKRSPENPLKKKRHLD